LGVSAQNLVPNPSFEEYWQCPQSDSNFDDVKEWYIASQSPEYFHSCSNILDMGVPLNAAGFQEAKDGEGYAGFFWFCDVGNAEMELIQVQLKDKLEKGKLYCLSFYISLADSSEYGIDRIGAFFSPNPTFGASIEEQKYTPQIETPPNLPFLDKIEWNIITDDFCANGDEQFLTIGNFHSNEEVNFYPSGYGGGEIGICAYYYVDMVELISCGICPGYVPELPNVLTPNGDGVNDEFLFEGDGITELRLFIYNRWGTEVYTQKGYGLNWNGRTNNGTRLTDGVYFYVIEGNGTRKSGTVSLFH
jgi:gliding motility-associated-like protein